MTLPDDWRQALGPSLPPIAAALDAFVAAERAAHRVHPPDSRVFAAFAATPFDAVRVVLENLLDNARKYGGGNVELVTAAKGPRWRLEVRDQGQGFSPGDAERLFEPFERGGGKGVAHGSGLGLYISRQLARRMHGELTAFSGGPGKGSTFTLELPLAREAARG